MKKAYSFLTALLVVTNFIVLFCLLQMENCGEKKAEKYNLVVHSDGVHPNLWDEESETSSNSLHVIIPQFDLHSHTLNRTVSSVLRAVPDSRTFILADSIPYPPLDLNEKELRVTIVITKVKPDYKSKSHISKLQSQLKTKYVLLMPDGVQLNAAELERMKQHSKTYPNDIIAGRVMGDFVQCLSVDVDFRNWAITYKEMPKLLDIRHRLCDHLTGEPVLLVPKKLLFTLTHPFALPWPHAFFIQTAYKNAKVMLSHDVVFKRVNKLRETYLERIQRKQNLARLTNARLKGLYNMFGIKKIVHSNGVVTSYGCSKRTPRCFGTIINSKPSYWYEGRNTPPCCLEALKVTARHVFKVLADCGVRYWLEGGSLLGAVRHGDIIPWDYDVDIGIYKEDIKKCIWLKQIDNSQRKPLIDDKEFIWERASEGDFYRVQYSLRNRLHVDIFPFYVRGGIMTKNTWIEGHKQDCEFPARFLKPLTAINFVGVNASAPNNIKGFLELKYGKGAIETPSGPFDI